MRAAVLAAALLALVAGAMPATAQKSQTPSAQGGLANEEGWDIDRILRRSRELDAQTRAVVPDERRYESWSRRVEKSRATALDSARRREAETRRRFDSEAAAQRLESMRARSVPRSSGEAIQDQETYSRLRQDAERARRAADDEIPRMWREQR
jgi:Spy/CpxP family protein refolding chaperone